MLLESSKILHLDSTCNNATYNCPWKNTSFGKIEAQDNESLTLGLVDCYRKISLIGYYLCLNLKESFTLIGSKIIWRIKAFLHASTLLITLIVMTPEIKASIMRWVLLHIPLAMFCNTIIGTPNFNFSEWNDNSFIKRVLKNIFAWFPLLSWRIEFTKRSFSSSFKKKFKIYKLSVLSDEFVGNEIV